MPSPLAGPALPPAPFPTLLDAVDALATRRDRWLTFHAGANEQPMTGVEVHDLARRWAGALRESGVRRGDRVLVLLPNDARFVGAFFGAVLLGAVPVPLAWPFALGNLAKAIAPLSPLVEAADATALATTPEIASAASWPVPRVTAPSSPAPVASTDASAPAFVQFTSGSLGRPRGAVISQAAAVASAWTMGVALDVGPGDVGVSWLPLFHDMGLVGALFCPLVHGFPLHLMAPAEFLLHPVRWLRRASAARATTAAAPDFAWALAARRVRDVAGLDLSAFTKGLDGAEPVHRSTIDAFSARFADVGFPRGGIRPVYGLAENTLGVCFSDPGRPAPDVVWQGRAVPSCGGPLPGVEVGVRRGDRWAEDGEEGEIVVRGVSRMTEYFRDPEATALAIRDGWLHTGDLGVLVGGQLHVTGREKDLVIAHGRKFHPYDVERVAAAAVDAPPNGAAAFSVARDDGEDLVVVVEHKGALGADDVEKRVRAGLMEELGIKAERVVRVAPGELPRTTSGKVRRRECASRWGAAGTAGPASETLAATGVGR